VRVAHGLSLSFFHPAAPREHDLRSSASFSSSRRPRPASRPCTPPTRAFVVHHASPFSATARLGAPLGDFGSSSAHVASFHRTGFGRLTFVTDRVPAMPSFRPTQFHQAPERRRTPANHPGAPALGSFIGRSHPRPNPHRPAASLTSACSGLASLATDARRYAAEQQSSSIASHVSAS